MESLLELIKKTDARTRIVAVAAVLALTVVGVTAGLISSRPHFVTLFSDLDDGQRVAVEKALASGTVKYRVSQPPGPYVVYVDDSSQYEAQNLVALAEALEPASVGIATGDGGAGTLFLSSGERQQGMLKREWQEMERQLKTLVFVSNATVTSSTPDNSPLKRGKPITVSVTLKLRGRERLSAGQADMVAKLVRYRFDVPAENVVVSDQSGRALYDPTEDQGMGSIKNMMEHEEQYDRRQQAKAHEALTRAFGIDKAFVTVTSEWDYQQSTSVSETVEPTKKVILEETTTSETPQGSTPSVGGPAGVSSNLSSNPGVQNAGGPSTPGTASPAASDLAKSKDTKKVYDTSRSTTQTVRSAPVLQRLSVSLMLDESLAQKRDEIEGIVKAAVGFDERRDDRFSLATATFALPGQADEESEEGEQATEGGDSGPSPMLEMLLERGIELIAALAFIVLLFKTLKSSAKTDTDGKTPAPGESVEDAPDPEVLARAQIEELVRTDPRRVGEVLSRWADEGGPTGT